MSSVFLEKFSSMRNLVCVFGCTSLLIDKKDDVSDSIIEYDRTKEVMDFNKRDKEKIKDRMGVVIVFRIEGIIRNRS